MTSPLYGERSPVTGRIAVGKDLTSHQAIMLLGVADRTFAHDHPRDAPESCLLEQRGFISWNDSARRWEITSLGRLASDNRHRL